MTPEQFDRLIVAEVGAIVGARVSPDDSPAEARRKVVAAARRALEAPCPLLRMLDTGAER